MAPTGKHGGTFDVHRHKLRSDTQHGVVLNIRQKPNHPNKDLLLLVEFVTQKGDIIANYAPTFEDIRVFEHVVRYLKAQQQPDKRDH